TDRVTRPCRLARACTTRWASTTVTLAQRRWRAAPVQRVPCRVSRSVMVASALGRVRTLTTTGAPCGMSARGTRTVTLGCAVLVAVGRGVAVAAGRAVGVAVAGGARVVATAATERADALPAASTASTVKVWAPLARAV